MLFSLFLSEAAKNAQLEAESAELVTNDEGKTLRVLSTSPTKAGGRASLHTPLEAFR